jgi:alkylhydroperoxidase family enzyme
MTLRDLRVLRGAALFRLRVFLLSVVFLVREYRYYRDYCDESRRTALRWAWVICQHRIAFWVGQASGLAQASGVGQASGLASKN